MDSFVDEICRRGAYATHDAAAHAARSVLSALGSHLVGDDRTDLASLLPPPTTPWLTEAVPAHEPLTPAGFLDAVAVGTGTSAEARRAVMAVLPTVAATAERPLLRRILTQLPPGYAPLFGCEDPSRQ